MSDYTLLSCVESVIIEPTELYGRFALGNFTKGQSLTIANALRRCLLSQLIGCAICFVEIRGINHPYESLPGMKESVLDVLFNLRQIKLKSDKTLFDSQLAYLSVLGPGIVRGRDLKLPYFISVVDPNQHIATLSPNAILTMKLIINCGKTYVKHTPDSFDSHNHANKLKQRSWLEVGYQSQSNLAGQWMNQRIKASEHRKQKNNSEQNKLTNGSKQIETNAKSSKVSKQPRKKSSIKSSLNAPLADHLEESFNKHEKKPPNTLLEKTGYFPIDATFAPVLKANYTIESVSQTKEKIYFEIWTNGSIDPRQAIHKASKALIELFLPLQGFQMLSSKAKPITKFKPFFTLNHNDSYKLRKRFRPQFKPKADKIEKEKLESISANVSAKQYKVEQLIYWLKTYVNNRPSIILKIVKHVLKPKSYAVDFKFGVRSQNSVKPIESLNTIEKLFNKQNPLKEYRLDNRIIVRSKAKSKEVKLKSVSSSTGSSIKNYIAEIRKQKKLANEQRLNKQGLKKRKLTKAQRLKLHLAKKKLNKKLTFQLSVLYFRHLILNVDLSQINLPYHIYLALKTNEIHNIEQLINISSAQLKKMLQLNNQQLKLIQTTLKHYVVEHLTKQF